MVLHEGLEELSSEIFNHYNEGKYRAAHDLSRNLRQYLDMRGKSIRPSEFHDVMAISLVSASQLGTRQIKDIFMIYLDLRDRNRSISRSIAVAISILARVYNNNRDPIEYIFKLLSDHSHVRYVMNILESRDELDTILNIVQSKEVIDDMVRAMAALGLIEDFVDI